MTTGNLKKAVTRNLGRFPEDRMFQLTGEEAANMRFQSVASQSRCRAGRDAGDQNSERAFRRHTAP
jgi:hypothetical protein